MKEFELKTLALKFHASPEDGDYVMLLVTLLTAQMVAIEMLMHKSDEIASTISAGGDPSPEDIEAAASLHRNVRQGVAMFRSVVSSRMATGTERPPVDVQPAPATVQ